MAPAVPALYTDQLHEHGSRRRTIGLQERGAAAVLLGNCPRAAAERRRGSTEQKMRLDEAAARCAAHVRRESGARGARGK